MYRVYMEMKWNFGKRYIYCYRMCAVFDCLVVFPIFYYNFTFQSDTLMLAHFIPLHILCNFEYHTKHILT